MFMETTHWSCTGEAAMMMRRHNADSGFCYSRILVFIPLTRIGGPADGSSYFQMGLPGYEGAKVAVRFEDLVANCALRDLLRFLLDLEIVPGTNVFFKCFRIVTPNAVLLGELAVGTAAA